MADNTEKILLVVLAVIVVASVIAGVAGSFVSSINTFTPEVACTEEGCAFDNPAGFCAINSSSEGSGIACETTPRTTSGFLVLFIPVIFIVFAVGIFASLRFLIAKFND